MLKFGTSGLRGLASELTDRECYLFTSAFFHHLNDKKYINKTACKIAIAGDFRPSTERILKAISAACVDFGCTVIYCGTVPTPTVSLYGFENHIPSIMVTGSHIPYDRNGIKFNLPHGEILKSDEQEITKKYKSLSDQNIFSDLFDSKGFLKEKIELEKITDDAKEGYAKRYTEFFPKNCLAGKKIVFYQHSAVIRDIFPDILERLGAKIINVGRTEDFVPIDTEAVLEEDIKRAKKWTKEFHPDAIMSTDGDSDRPLLFDQQGEFIRGDIIDIYCALYLEADSVSATASCNTALEKCERFKKINRTRIGSPYVVEAMYNDVKSGYQRVVSYEANGGFLTASEIELDGKKISALPTRDAVLPLLSVMMLAKKHNETLSGLKKLIPQRFVFSQSIKGIQTEKSNGMLGQLMGTDREAKLLAKKYFDLPSEIEKFDFTDGARIYLKNDEIVHVRPSGNSPELRAYCETASLERSKNLVNLVLNAAKKSIQNE